MRKAAFNHGIKGYYVLKIVEHFPEPIRYPCCRKCLKFVFPYKHPSVTLGTSNTLQPSKILTMKQVLFSMLSAAFLLTSCVSSKKFKAANEQIAGLNTQVADLTSKASALEGQVNQLKTENIQYGKEAEDCRKAKEAIATRLDNLNKKLAERGTSLSDILERTETALQAFKEQGAEVTSKNGLVYISMPDKLAFRSGSTQLSKDGKKLLSIVADVLKDNPGVSAVIVGNTDAVPVKSAFKDNWSLSTERANAAVRVLKSTYHADPARVTAAGKGQYDPIGDNSTAAGRAKNRRNMIILNPDLSRFWELSKGE